MRGILRRGAAVLDVEGLTMCMFSSKFFCSVFTSILLSDAAGFGLDAVMLRISVDKSFCLLLVLLEALS